MIRIIIIDDEILARIGIQTFLEGKQDIMVQGTFSSPWMLWRTCGEAARWIL